MNKKIFLYEFKKIINIPVVLFIILIFIFKIAVSINYNMNYDQSYNDTFDEMIVIAVENGYVEDYTQIYITNEINSLLSGIEEREEVQINAQNNEFFSLSMPDDYIENIDLYASFVLPELINNTRWNLFFQLNTFNFITAIAVLFYSNIISKEKESSMDMIIKSSAIGEKVVMKHKIVLTLGITSLIYILSFLVDFIGSMFYKVFDDFDKPLSSLFPKMLSELSLGEFLIRYFLVGFLFAIFFTLLVLVFSSMFPTSSLSIISMVIFLSSSIFADYLLPSNIVVTFLTGNLSKLYSSTNLLNRGKVIYWDMIFIFVYSIFIILFIAYLTKSKRGFKK
ncbi:MAG: hypothetical protein R3Y35_12215 [Clostridia bacterium]